MNSAGQGLGKGFCLIYKVQRNEVLKRVQQDKVWGKFIPYIQVQENEVLKRVQQDKDWGKGFCLIYRCSNIEVLK